MSCGAHGSCSNGACSCTDGYSGAQCEVARDPCAVVNCGAQGTCSVGVCSCSGGYTGSSCEIAPNPCASISCAQQPEGPNPEPAAAPVITPEVTNPDPAQQQPAVTPVEPSNAPADPSTAPVVQPVVPTGAVDPTTAPTHGPADLPASGRNRSSSSSPSPAPGDPTNTNSPAPSPTPSTPSPEPPTDPSQSPPPSPSPKPRRSPRPRPPRPGGNGGHNHDDHYHYDDNTYDDMLYNYDYGGRGGPYNPRGGGYGPYNPYSGQYDPYNSQYDPYKNQYNGRGGYPGYNGYNDYGAGGYPAGGYNPVMGGGYNPYSGGGGYGGGGVPNSGYYNPAKFGFTANFKAQPGFLNCSDTQVPVFAMVTPVNRTQPTGKSRALFNLTRTETFKACEGGSRLLSQPVGPFPADACATYTVTSTLRMRPLTGTPLQPAFSSLATAQLEVTGCPASSSPSNTAAAAATASASAVKVSIANIKATTFYSSSWRITASSNVTAGKLVVQQGKAAAVEVVAALSKSAKRTEFAAVSGVVEVEGLSSAATALSSVQVTALTRTGQPLLVDAACPADSTSADGAIAVPPAPAKLSCSFTIQGMPPTPGAVSALVRIAGAAAPLPVQPAEYAVTPGSSTTGSSKDAIQSSCLKVGPLRNQLVKASKGAGESATAAAVKGMPVLDVASNFPVGSVCDSLEKTGYTLTFGLFGAKDSGVYAFQSEWQVTGAGSAAAAQPLLLERPDINFAVEVVGCVAGE
ncbi:hypothetical protein OEZ86_010757 [Tetradesmus obliquus]|nr:hypothetical protein OEZ86_010757 [Tetradesmus obliquus]